jgi:hypothetical protein
MTPSLVKQWDRSTIATYLGVANVTGSQHYVVMEDGRIRTVEMTRKYSNYNSEQQKLAEEAGFKRVTVDGAEAWCNDGRLFFLLSLRMTFFLLSLRIYGGGRGWSCQHRQTCRNRAASAAKTQEFELPAPPQQQEPSCHRRQKPSELKESSCQHRHN